MVRIIDAGFDCWERVLVFGVANVGALFSSLRF